MSRLPAGKRLRLLFQDEARLGRISDQRRGWAPLPFRPVVGHQVMRQFVYGLAAVSPLDGQFCSWALPWVDTETMSLFLACTAAQFRNDYCGMGLDGAGWHTALDLRVPPSLQLLSLPPYRPELNPVEHIGEHLRENHFGNRLFNSLDQVVAQLCVGLRPLHRQLKLVQSMTCFDWIKALPLTLN